MKLAFFIQDMDIKEGIWLWKLCRGHRRIDYFWKQLLIFGQNIDQCNNAICTCLWILVTQAHGHTN